MKTLKSTAFKLLFICLMMASFSGKVLAESSSLSTGPLLDRIKRVERDLTVLQRQIYRGQVTISDEAGNDVKSEIPRTSSDRFQQKISELEDVIRNLTGEAERVSYATSQIESRLNRIVSDVDYRLRRIEEQLNIVNTSSPEKLTSTPEHIVISDGKKVGMLGGNRPDPHLNSPSMSPLMPVSTSPTAAPVARLNGAVDNSNTDILGPEEQYKRAYSLLKQADYSAAEKALEAFVAAYPRHDLAGNGQYWLGETYYVRGDYERAAVAFADGYKNYKNSAKGADNLLKLGLSMARLGKKENACIAFKSVAKEFANATDMITKRAEREAGKLSCK